MANLYWPTVTTAFWSAATWRTTSGTAPGTSGPPTAADNVFLDANSGGTCYITDNSLCLNLDCTGFTGTLAHADSTTTLTISGTLCKLVAGMTYTPTATGQTIIFNGATGPVLFTSAAKVTGTVNINTTSGVSVTLQDALTTRSDAPINITQGVLTTNGMAVTCRYLNMTGSGVKALNATNSSVTMNIGTLSQTTVIDWGGTNITFTGTGSTFTINKTTPATNHGWLFASAKTFAFNNLTFGAASNANAGMMLVSAAGASTVITASLLTINGPCHVGFSPISSPSYTFTNMTVAGSISSPASVRSGAQNVQTTLTLTNAASLNYCMIGDINLSQASTANSSWCLGNTANITFNAPSGGGGGPVGVIGS